MLEGRNIHFRFEPRMPLLEDVSIRIPHGGVVGVWGPSGCGKSTLGRLLAGHLRAGSGSVLLDGALLPSRGLCPVQYLAQTPIVTMNPRWRIGRILREAHDPCSHLRDALGVERAWDDRFPHELSGGQLQRVSLLRALAPCVRYLIADEITSTLDAVGQADLWRVLLAIASERSIGLLVVSQDDALLRRVAKHRVALNPGGIGANDDATTPLAHVDDRY